MNGQAPSVGHASAPRNILWLIAEKGVGVSMTLFCAGLLARALPLDQFGKWQYAQGTGALLSSLFLIVGSEVIVPSLSRHRKATSIIVSSGFILRLLGVVFALPVGFVLVSLTVKDQLAATLTLYFMTQLALNEAFGVISNYFQARTNIRWVVLCRLSALAFRSMIFAVIYLTTRSIYCFAAAMAIECFVTVILLLRLATRFRLEWKPRFKVGKILLLRGMKFWPGLILMYLFTRGDRFYAEHFFSYQTVGQFSISQQLVEQGFIMLMMVVQSIAPNHFFNKKTNKSLLRRTLWVGAACALITTMLCAIAFIVGPVLINRLYGPQYRQGVEFFRVMCFAMIPYSLDAVLNTVILREKAAGLLFLKWLAAAAVSFFIYRSMRCFGQSALGYAYLCSYFMLFIFSLLCTASIFYKNNSQ